MRHAIQIAAGALTLSLTLAMPAAAQEFRFPPANLFAQAKPAPRPPSVEWNRRPSVEPAAKPSVVCGMTVIPADPKIDPKMRVTPPDRGVVYALRVVPPTVCKTP